MVPHPLPSAWPARISGASSRTCKRGAASCDASGATGGGMADPRAHVLRLLAMRHAIASEPSARYNTTAAQRDRIIWRLQHGPATRDTRTRECDAPSVTKRISELRRMGWPIVGHWAYEGASDGSANAATLYSLAVIDTPQRDLFGTE